MARGLAMKAWLVALVLAACGPKDELPGDVFHSPRWALTLGGSGADRVYVVAFDPAGDVLAAGGFSGVVGFGSTTLGSFAQQGGVDGRQDPTRFDGRSNGSESTGRDRVKTATTRMSRAVRRREVAPTPGSRPKTASARAA